MAGIFFYLCLRCKCTFVPRLSLLNRGSGLEMGDITEYILLIFLVKLKLFLLTLFCDPHTVAAIWK